MSHKEMIYNIIKNLLRIKLSKEYYDVSLSGPWSIGSGLDLYERCYLYNLWYNGHIIIHIEYHPNHNKMLITNTCGSNISLSTDIETMDVFEFVLSNDFPKELISGCVLALYEDYDIIMKGIKNNVE